MAREPKKTVRLTIATPIRPDLFKDVEVVKRTGDEKAPDPRLAEVVAALRREMEAVALIAAPEDREVPRFQVSEVELDFSYAVTALEDDGVRVVIDREKLTDIPDARVQRMKLRLVDPDVQALMAQLKQDN